MDGTTADFSSTTWRDRGVLEQLRLEADDSGKIVPTFRFIDLGGAGARTGTHWYLMAAGMIEKVTSGLGYIGDKKPQIYSLGAIPLGLGKSGGSVRGILEAMTELEVTVRRTAGSSEKVVYSFGPHRPELIPWKRVLGTGVVYPASKVVAQVHLIPLDEKCRFRVAFITVTSLGSSGCYKIPKTILDTSSPLAISFNLLVKLSTEADITKVGIMPKKNEEGETVVDTLIHVGLFVRKSGKIYSAAYCKAKVEKMDLVFALAGVGGVSFHVTVNGKVSKQLRAQLGGHKTICYSLMDINPNLNRILWRPRVEIKGVTAVFQPSIPKDFKRYDNVLVDNVGKIRSLKSITGTK